MGGGGGGQANNNGDDTRFVNAVHLISCMNADAYREQPLFW